MDCCKTKEDKGCCRDLKKTMQKTEKKGKKFLLKKLLKGGVKWKEE